MARKLRIEYEGACYHIMGRGNYRTVIFEDDGSKWSFLSCMKEVSERCDWKLHGYCLMSNHYHLALETPQGNLVDGMRWLQSTFANRFNRFRGENGHVFQGRYKSLLVENDGMGPLCHYIHLNPVRAHMVKTENLSLYRWSSFWQLVHPRQRWSNFSVSLFLDAAGGLKDTPKGRIKYQQFLDWLQENELARKEMKFERMSKGWALGTQAFKKSILESLEKNNLVLVEKETGELRVLQWERFVEHCLRLLQKGETDVLSEKKSAQWKVSIACVLRKRFTARNAWIAERLNMGRAESVSRYVHEMQRGQRGDLDIFKKLLQ